MVDGDVRGACLEVLDRIPALGHHGLDQVVRRRDRCARVVDELCLHGLPLRRVPLACRARERPDLELLAPFTPRGELRLGGPLAVRGLERAVVLGAELALELLRLACASSFPTRPARRPARRRPRSRSKPMYPQVPPQLRIPAPSARARRRIVLTVRRRSELRGRGLDTGQACAQTPTEDARMHQASTAGVAPRAPRDAGRDEQERGERDGSFVISLLPGTRPSFEPSSL